MNHADRRRFLMLGGAGALLTGSSFGRPAGLRALLGGAVDGGSDRALVLVQLSGGNDGLNTVVPFADDAYHSARPKIALPAGKLRKVDEERGLHPALEKLHRQYSEGRVAIVEGVGYPEPNRSHFKSMDVWHAADPRGRARDEGWIGRLLDGLYGAVSDPSHSVHVGKKVPYSMRSTKHAAACFGDAERYRWMSNTERMERLAGAAGGEGTGESSLDFVRRVMADAQSSSEAVRQGALRYKANVEYPRGDFGDSLWTAAALVSAGIGCRVLSVNLGGFDTHVDQLGRHANRMETLDAALGAFLEDLQGTPAGKNAVVLVFSEFGRRVAENGSRGTDHGTAGPVFVAGEPVRGGVYGARPSLTELDAGDLAYTTDFRSVYAAIASGWFGVDPEPIVGAGHEPLPLFG